LTDVRGLKQSHGNHVSDVVSDVPSWVEAKEHGEATAWFQTYPRGV